MSKVCKITGKRPRSGHTVSHSNRKAKRRFLPNIRKKKIFNPKTGKMEKMKVSAHGLRILKKKMR
ncbi:50S ribosomal protein L28 [Candidatus Peregrinibacteria bacterium]|nr:50S ribosomal protein L28 [Candidatus Peregrinibacteria bacterium]